MDRAGELAGQIGLARRNRLAVENLAIDAILPRALEDRRTALASVASERNSLIQPVRRNSSGTPASAISASCSIRLRRISGNSAIALCSARSGEDARK